MTRKIITSILIVSLIILPITWIYIIHHQPNIIIQKAKIVTGIDKNMQPLKETDLFPKDTSKVCLWISWRNAEINTQIWIKWYYLTDDIPVDNYAFTIPIKQGVASVFLSMPKGKSLPSGSYKADILLGQKQLTKTLFFEIK